MPDGERAVQIDIGVQWETGAPMPQLLVGLRTFLLFYSPPEKGNPAKDRVGLVEIVGCAAARFGPPNDEALENHPLGAAGCSSTPLIKLTTLRGCLNGVNSRIGKAHKVQRSPRNCVTSSLLSMTKPLRSSLRS